jgi:hypothetical protein
MLTRSLAENGWDRAAAEVGQITIVIRVSSTTQLVSIQKRICILLELEAQLEADREAAATVSMGQNPTLQPYQACEIERQIQDG